MVAFIELKGKRPSEICYICRDDMTKDDKPLVAHLDKTRALVHPAHRECAIIILESGNHHCYCETEIDPSSVGVISERRSITLIEEEAIPWGYVTALAVNSLICIGGVAYGLLRGSAEQAAFLSAGLNGITTGSGLAFRSETELNLSASLMMITGSILAVYEWNIGLAVLFTAAGIVPRIIIDWNNPRISQVHILALSVLVSFSTWGCFFFADNSIIQDSLLCYTLVSVGSYILHRIKIHQL